MKHLINTDTAKLLNACTGMKLLIEEGVEQMEVCKAIRDIEEDAKMEGRMEGRMEAIEVLVEALQKLGQTSESILQTLMEGFSISESEAKKYMK